MTDQPSLARLRTRWAAIGAAIAITLGAGTLTTVNAVTTSGERAIYNAITPCRITDTRPEFQTGPRSTPLGTNDTMTIAARGARGDCTANDLPNDATALALNITTTDATLPTFLTIWPDGARPNASSLNPAPGQPPTPNAVTTPLSATGNFNVYNLQGNVNIIIDVVGYYTDHNHDDRYVLANPDSVTPPLLHGVAEGAAWKSNLFGWNHDGTSESCLSIPVDTAAGRIVDNLTILYAASDGPAVIDVFMISSNIQPGVITDESDVYNRNLASVFTLPATAVDELGQAVITDDPSALPTLRGKDPTVDDGSTVLRLCTDTELAVLEITVHYEPQN